MTKKVARRTSKNVKKIREIFEKRNLFSQTSDGFHIRGQV